jgi:hypothetical protein
LLLNARRFAEIKIAEFGTQRDSGTHVKAGTFRSAPKEPISYSKSAREQSGNPNYLWI